MTDSSDLTHLIGQDTQLPTLPSNVPYLMKALGSENMTFQQIADAIAKFPTITARLIFLANSAWASAAVPIENIELACARLGLSIVRSVSISLAVGSIFDPSHCKAFDVERFWCSSLMVADGAALLVKHCSKSTKLDVNTMHTAGLLHNIGLLWLAEYNATDTHKALQTQETETEETTVCARLEEFVGVDYCQVGEVLGSAWQLPSVLTTVMKEHRNLNYGGPHCDYTVLVGYVALMVSALYHDQQERPQFTEHPQVKLNPSNLDYVFSELKQKKKDYTELSQLIYSAS